MRAASLDTDGIPKPVAGWMILACHDYRIAKFILSVWASKSTYKEGYSSGAFREDSRDLIGFATGWLFPRKRR
jgi:hypothetical protein